MTTRRSITLHGTRFVKKGADGDYAFMVKQKHYENALFVLYENYIDSLRDDAGRGGGTAVLRPKTFHHMTADELAAGPPRAAGVPTGWSTETQGFPHIDNLYIKRAIDLSIERIKLILDTWPTISTLVYSCDEADPMFIGTGIFKTTIDPTVVRYISTALHQLPNSKPSKLTFDRIRKKELELLPFPLLVDKNQRLENKVDSLEAKVRHLERENALLKRGRETDADAGSGLPPKRMAALPFRYARLGGAHGRGVSPWPTFLGGTEREEGASSWATSLSEIGRDRGASFSLSSLGAPGASKRGREASGQSNIGGWLRR